MSTTTDDVATDQRAIVIHAPLTGDPARINELPEALRSDAALRAPTVVRELPPSIRDPHVHRAELAARAAQNRVRVFGLDAVRGISLLAMNLTFALPSVMLLPAWMYHTQYPPPTGAYVARAGLTWQDIIFPGFLFAMAAAIPIRGSQLIAAGEPMPSILWGALKRTALLYLFSLIIGHVNPFETHNETRTGNLIAIAGFLTLFALFVQRKPEWNPSVFVWLRRVGWVGAAILLFVLPATWGGSFSMTRRDTIITSIAFVYVVCTLIWLVTRQKPMLRLAIVLVVAVLKVLSPVVGPVGAFWSLSPMPWLYEPWFFELLLIALPGTIAGDLLVEWTRYAAGDRPASRDEEHLGHLRGVAAIGFGMPVVLVVGLYQRQLIGTTAAVLASVLAGAYLLRRGTSDRDRLLARIGAWAGALLIAGILLEPLEGGIKKDPQTMSFLLLCGGLWLGVLLAATILIDVVGGAWRRIFEPIILAGQNAMLAYVIFTLFLLHIAYYLGFGDFLSATPPQQVVRGVLVTTVVMALLWTASKKRIVWRS
ncbi:MAG: DUF5009 domain-containing protein [Gemmatimonadota bacterium]